MDELNSYDRIMQKKFPTIMVPKHSPLPPCEVNQTRLLMANDGLYLETRKEWGGLVRRIWEGSREVSLPYGEVAEKDDFISVLHEHVMPLFTAQMLTEAISYADEGKEWAGFVVWDGSRFLPWKEQFVATAESVDFKSHQIANLPEAVVADIHSHGSIPPFFSPDDNKSDIGGIKISIVLGSYGEKKGRIFDWVARYCVSGFFLGSEDLLKGGGEQYEYDPEELQTLRGLLARLPAR